MINRRKFMAQASAGIAGTVLSTQAFAHLFPQKKEKLGIALVGLGYYSTNLLAPALMNTKFCHLTGIVTGTPSKAEEWKKKYNIPDKNIYNYQNFDSIANNPDIDVVYIVLPNSLHAEFTIRAARAGKHVWCEKPMAMNSNECQAMIAACHQNKVKLSIGYRMQHEANTKTIIGYRKNKTYGKILKVEASAGFNGQFNGQWRQKRAYGGGAMYDMGVYALNAARYCTGLEPIAVTARSSTTRLDIFNEVDETMKFNLEFPGGVMAVCETSFGKNLNDLKVTCDKGWYSLSPFQGYNGIKGLTSSGVTLEIERDSPVPYQQARQMDDDAQSILNNSPVMVPGEEGLKDMRIVDAIYKSDRDKMRIEIS